MTAITLTAARVEPVFPELAEKDIKSYICAEAITKGQAVYILATDTVGVADANASGKQQFRGIALEGGGIGQSISVQQGDDVFGFDIQALDSDVLVYLSDTAGGLDTAPGTMTVPVGRVRPMSDPDKTRVLRIAVNWLAQWT
jgi:hypothetical protein